MQLYWFDGVARPLKFVPLVLVALSCLEWQWRATAFCGPLYSSYKPGWSPSASLARVSSLGGQSNILESHLLCVKPVDQEGDETATKKMSQDISISKTQRLVRWRKRLSSLMASSILTGSLLLGRVSVAGASPKDDLRANDIILHSLKPGVSVDEAEKAIRGEALDEADEEVLVGNLGDDLVENGASMEKRTQKASKKKKIGYDYGGDDGDYDEEEEELVEFEGENKRSDLPTKDKLANPTSFAVPSASKPVSLTKMYVTSAVSVLILPVTWLQTREILRSRRERNYVKKGLAIMQAQKAEYFNVTSTVDDSDIEDELKGMKNETNPEDDDDDDDDDDDEE